MKLLALMQIIEDDELPVEKQLVYPRPFQKLEEEHLNR